MQIKVNSNHLEGSAQLQEWASDTVFAALAPYEGMIARVEVHLGDEGQDDSAAAKRCRIDVRCEGLSPISVTEEDQSMARAVEGAVEQAVRVLERSSEGSNTPQDSALQVDAMREDEFLAGQADRDKQQ